MIHNIKNSGDKKAVCGCDIDIHNSTIDINATTCILCLRILATTPLAIEKIREKIKIPCWHCGDLDCISKPGEQLTWEKDHGYY